MLGALSGADDAVQESRLGLSGAEAREPRPVADPRERSGRRSVMSVMMVRARVRDESIPEVEAAVRELFSAIDRARPDGVRYAATRVADAPTFVILVEFALGNENENPLQAVPEFGRFQEQLKGWMAEAPTVDRLDVVGSYNLFSI
jgi:hypothetical protein